MRIPLSLSESNRLIWTKIVQPLPAAPLTWGEVRALMREIGQVRWEPDGDFKVVRNGHILILRPAPTALVSGADEFLELQRFLERSGGMPPYLDPTRQPDDSAPVVISPVSPRSAGK